MQSTLVLFCKRPKPGQGKQRLAQSIGQTNALMIAEALWQCAQEDCQAWPGKYVLAISHQDDQQWAEANTPKQTQVIYQGEGNLGERINHVDQYLRQHGHKHCVYIGTDSPTLSTDFIIQAAQKLQQHDIVFSPSQDGGVVLMGNRIAWPNLQKLPWSCNNLYQELSKQCQQLGYNISQYQSGFDIDTISELQKLKTELSDDKRPARQRLYQMLNYLEQNGAY